MKLIYYNRELKQQKNYLEVDKKQFACGDHLHARIIFHIKYRSDLAPIRMHLPLHCYQQFG